MLPLLSRSFCVCLFLLAFAFMTNGQSNLTARANNLQPTIEGSNNDSDRARDGLVGPVRRVRTEVVKVSTASGKLVEDPKRVLLETAEYDLKGAKTQNQYFPLAGTLTGRETYTYDDTGNISEMTLMNADGSLLSKEVYKYEFDSIGNWIKMTTSVALVVTQKIDFEPTEITYRTIFYYLDASMAKMLPTNGSAPATSGGSGKADPNANARITQLPPASASLDKSKSAVVQLPGANVSTSGSPNSQRLAIASDAEAPAPRILKPVSGGVLNGKALSLPVPVYPQFAMRSRTAGKVEVEVIVDETGKVISAQAFSGPTPLRDAAVEAAKRARFSPTKLSGVAVKISGIINYNFTLP